jgi:hypothetical protein
MAQLQLGTSRNQGICDVPHCAARWTVIIHDVLAPTVRIAVFGTNDIDSDIFCLCKKHYSYLHRRDGVTLGYRKVNGKLRAYIKEESF